MSIDHEALIMTLPILRSIHLKYRLLGGCSLTWLAWWWLSMFWLAVGLAMRKRDWNLFLYGVVELGLCEARERGCERISTTGLATCKWTTKQIFLGCDWFLSLLGLVRCWERVLDRIKEYERVLFSCLPPTSLSMCWACSKRNFSSHVLTRTLHAWARFRGNKENPCTLQARSDC